MIFGYGYAVTDANGHTKKIMTIGENESINVFVLTQKNPNTTEYYSGRAAGFVEWCKERGLRCETFVLKVVSRD